MCQSLHHDTAFALAKALLEIVQNCIREDEHRDALDAFFEATKAALSIYDIKRERMEHRLEPSRN